MKTVSLYAASLILTALLVVSITAQNNPVKSTGENKIALINSSDFTDAKTGIIKYINAVKTLESEFKPVQTELEGLEMKLQSLAKEIQTFKDNAPKIFRSVRKQSTPRLKNAKSSSAITSSSRKTPERGWNAASRH